MIFYLCTIDKNILIIMMGGKCEMIIGKCIEQNLKFKKLDNLKNYYTIHHSHYDWWAFPIN